MKYCFGTVQKMFQSQVKETCNPLRVLNLIKDKNKYKIWESQSENNDNMLERKMPNIRKKIYLRITG